MYMLKRMDQGLNMSLAWLNLSTKHYLSGSKLSIMQSQDQLTSQLEDQFLDCESNGQQLFDDWEEIILPTPCDFTGKSYHPSFNF